MQEADPGGGCFRILAAEPLSGRASAVSDPNASVPLLEPLAFPGKVGCGIEREKQVMGDLKNLGTKDGKADIGIS